MNAPSTAILHPYSVTRVQVGIIIGLRNKVLLPDQPREAAHFEGDDDPNTHHFAAILNGDASSVGCVSLMQVN